MRRNHCSETPKDNLLLFGGSTFDLRDIFSLDGILEKLSFRGTHVCVSSREDAHYLCTDVALQKSMLA